MNCFSCFYFHGKKRTPKDSDNNSRRRNGKVTSRDNNKTHPEIPTKTEVEKNKNNDAEKEISNNIAAQTFTFRELATATKNFRQECLIGEGGFGRVYKGVVAREDGDEIESGLESLELEVVDGVNDSGGKGLDEKCLIQKWCLCW
ncbi:hypothetical protein F2Q70_00030262 [Brassica cretica]|uniref:Protein kinase domain-containing protein n=1 Tax=Brassica cretica TaxID=69181 RepID=A0A8S9FI69_BRACR|nr:hypothetical protein F2Q70_00030262 [Brassica cretica]